MYDINFYQQLLARVCSTKWKQFFKQEKVFQVSGVILATEQSIKSFSFIFLGFYLYIKSTFTIQKFMNDFWNDFSRTPRHGTSASMFYIVIDYENEPNMKVAASNANIKIHLFSKQPILGVRMTIAQRKTSGGLTRTGY